MPPAIPAGTFSINFTAANTYNVENAASVVIGSGTYTPGQTITYGGAQVTLSGQPAVGDYFNVTPSGNQSLFTTVQNLVTALQAGASSPIQWIRAAE